MENFTHAIVRRPGRSLINGLSSGGLRPDYNQAISQHLAYSEALESCGLEVLTLPPAEHFPDSCFIEDPALLTPDCAIITNPGAPSRCGEAPLLADTLAKFYPPQHIHRITAPGALDGGDIMATERHYYIGRSERTNAEGAAQLAHILSQYGYSSSEVPLQRCLHLKSHVNYLDNDTLLLTGEFIDSPLFAGFRQLIVPAEEAYAANSLWINGLIIVPAGYPQTLRLLRQAGYKTLTLDMSEFRKLDGGLSCLSLRFRVKE